VILRCTRKLLVVIGSPVADPAPARDPEDWYATIVADPDGNDVGLMSPIDESRRTWPPEESPAP
jgi:hypothetical protein